MKDKFVIEYHQKKMKNKQSSFWYDGDIATLKYKGRQVSIVVSGEIRICKKGGELVHDGYKERGSGIKLNNDKDLKKIGNNYTDNYYWENNNWFEIFYVYDKCNNVVYEDCIMGDVAYTYKEAIALAKHYLKDDEFWNRLDDKHNGLNKNEDKEDR